MRLAICDDDIRFAGKMEEWAVKALGNGLACDVYLSGEELLKAAENGEKPYQIYLLDIEMGKMTGMEAAYEIRKKDLNALIIFLTSHVEKMPEAFEVNAFHYLVKPVEEEKLREVLTRAWNFLNRERSFFTFQVGRKEYMEACEDILYLESVGRKIRVQTAKEDYEYYGTLKEAMKTLEKEAFVQVHQAYLVNLKHLESVERDEVRMRDGTKIPVSRTYRKVFQKACQEYVLKGAV